MTPSEAAKLAPGTTVRWKNTAGGNGGTARLEIRREEHKEWRAELLTGSYAGRSDMPIGDSEILEVLPPKTCGACSHARPGDEPRDPEDLRLCTHLKEATCAQRGVTFAGRELRGQCLRERWYARPVEEVAAGPRVGDLVERVDGLNRYRIITQITGEKSSDVWGLGRHTIVGALRAYDARGSYTGTHPGGQACEIRVHTRREDIPALRRELGMDREREAVETSGEEDEGPVSPAREAAVQSSQDAPVTPPPSSPTVHLYWMREAVPVEVLKAALSITDPDTVRATLAMYERGETLPAPGNRLTMECLIDSRKWFDKSRLPRDMPATEPLRIDGPWRPSEPDMDIPDVGPQSGAYTRRKGERGQP